MTNMRKGRRANAGFTLIELLVVVAIIGILAGIAIPQFAGRQGKAFDARVIQDARNAASAEEAYYTDRQEYFEGDCTLLPGMKPSAGTTCTATVSGSGFEIETKHPRATRTCHWSSTSSPNLSCS